VPSAQLELRLGGLLKGPSRAPGERSHLSRGLLLGSVCSARRERARCAHGWEAGSESDVHGCRERAQT
jgi:hypothetical protein